jgi:putative glutamine amidotransferase
MKKPIIVIPGWKTGENSFGCGHNYLEFMRRFGVPRILMPEEDVVEDASLLLLPGGPDLNPIAYGGVPSMYSTAPDLFRQYFYDKVLDKYIEAGVPIFGICLGMQQLCVKFGSKMTQNLFYHEQSKDRWMEAHKVYPINFGLKYFPIKDADRSNEKKNSFEVNSHHHQGVVVSELGVDLEVIATAWNHDNPKDELVEAFMHKELPIAGVQWHPEEMFNTFAHRMVNTLIASAESRTSNKKVFVPGF